MDFGLYGLHRGSSIEPATLVRRARLAEEAGFESLWIGDHVALTPEMGADEPRLEAVVAVSYLAACTSTVRLGFGVLVLPQRQPVLLAKQLASIDALCGGRLIVGIGVGYVEPELAAFGVSLAERGARTDEYLDAMRALWRGDHLFVGRFVQFDGVYQRPVKPPPIVIAGHSDAALRRAARVGDGWYGVYLSVEKAAGLLTKVPDGLHVTITPPPGPIDRDTIRRYADLGVDRLAVQPADPGGDEIERLIDAIGASR